MSVVGIYFGPKIICIVETEGKIFRNSIQVPRQRISPAGIDEKIPEEIKIATILKDELAKKNINATEANIVLLGTEMIIRTFYMPVIPQNELDNAVRFEAKKYIPFKLEELVSDFQVRFDKTSRKNFILFVGIKKEILDKYLNILEQLKIKARSVEYSGFSIFRLLKLAKVKEKSTSAIINIDLAEEDEVNFIILEKGLPLFSRDIILTTESPLSPGGTAKIDFAAILEKLKVELRISLDFYLRKFPTKNIKNVIFIAPEDLRLDLETFVKERGLGAKFINVKNPIYFVPDKTIRETRILAKDEIIDISVTQVPVSSEIPHGVKYSFNYRVRTNEGWKTLIRFDNAHIIKGHHKRDHKHMFENDVQEIEFYSAKELMNELMRSIENNRRNIDEIKRR